MTETHSGPDLLSDLAHEFAERFRRGERPDLAEYTDRYPDLAEQIRDLFPALVVMEQFGSVAGPPPPAAPGPRVPPQLGEYRILREVGRGGMGIVYEAVQESLGRHVALKVLPFHGLISPTHLERFEREAKAVARLHHTNIVPVFGIGMHAGVHYYAMQFIQGQGLDTVLNEVRRLRGETAAASGQAVTVSLARGLLTGNLDSPVPGAACGTGLEAAMQSSATPVPSLIGDHPSELTGPSEAQYFRGVARLGIQVAEALAYAHRQGIVHRDIKPSNLLLDTQGVVWVTDFGLVKDESGDQLTQTGDIVGTVRYMAPERFDGRGDGRSDLYSLGATLYELVTLGPAFADANRARLVERVLHDEPLLPRKLDPRIPRDLETIIVKAMAKDPSGRYQTAGELAEDLRRFLADRPVHARRSSTAERTWRWCRRNPALAALAASVLVLLLAVAGVASVGYAQTSAALGRAEAQRKAAEHEREVARTAQNEATDKAARFRRLHYDADMQLVARLWPSETSTSRVVAEMLEAHIPGPGEEDLRDFAWHYQWRLLHDPPALKQEAPILAAATAPGGDVVTYDGSLLCFWDRTTCRDTGRRSQAALPNRCCWQLSGDGTLLAVGTTDGRVQLYDTATGHERSFLRGTAPLKDVCFSTDGRKLATLHADWQVRAWEVATGKELAAFSLGLPPGANAVAKTEPSYRGCALSRDG
jgi:serine/threonine protein kinase